MDKIFDTDWKYVRKSTKMEMLYDTLLAIAYVIIAFVSAIVISDGWWFMFPFMLIALFCFGIIICEFGIETIGNVGNYGFDDE